MLTPGGHDAIERTFARRSCAHVCTLRARLQFVHVRRCALVAAVAATSTPTDAHRSQTETPRDATTVVVSREDATTRVAIPPTLRPSSGATAAHVTNHDEEEDHEQPALARLVGKKKKNYFESIRSTTNNVSVCTPLLR